MSFKHSAMDTFVMCGVSKVQRFVSECLVDVFFPQSPGFCMSLQGMLCW